MKQKADRLLADASQSFNIYSHQSCVVRVCTPSHHNRFIYYQLLTLIKLRVNNIYLTLIPSTLKPELGYSHYLIFIIFFKCPFEVMSVCRFRLLPQYGRIGLLILLV